MIFWNASSSGRERDSESSAMEPGAEPATESGDKTTLTGIPRRRSSTPVSFAPVKSSAMIR